jgi:hypothetical protein
MAGVQRNGAARVEVIAYFGIFCLMGCWLEQLEGRTSLPKLLDNLESSQWWHIAKLLDVFTPLKIRIKPDTGDQLQAWLDTRKLLPQQQEFVEKWVAKKFNLVGRKG